MEQVIAKQGFDIIHQLFSYGPLGIVAAIYIIDHFGLLNNHKNDTKKNIQCIKEDVSNMSDDIKDLEHIKEEIHDLHKWHDTEDEDGVKRWYMPRSFEATQVKLGDLIDKNTKVLERLVFRVEDMTKVVHELRK